MAIHFISDFDTDLHIDKSSLTEWINNVAAIYNKYVGKLTYVFSSDEKVLEINRQFLEHNYYTDIITFDNSAGDIIAGDIIISYDRVKNNAEIFKTEINDELYRVIIHGVLHLCGLRDETEEEITQMRHAENKALDMLYNLK